jgi:antitoxin ParD1/3/4
MPTRNVVITDHQAALIERLVSCGQYQNASEVLRDGLRLVEERERLQDARVKAFEAAIAEGEAAFAAGDYTVIETETDLEAFMRSLETG